MIKKLLFILMIASFFSCNKEWEDEQFEHYVSFVAPLPDGQGVFPIYLRYAVGGTVTYELPIIVSGSTPNNQDLAVHVQVDEDTLSVLNLETFQNRTDIYYKQLSSQFFSLRDDVVNIKSGSTTGILNIDFTLDDIDLVDKWVLPLEISDDQAGYVANPRKYYRKALLRIIPFNDYSGNYNATNYKIFLKGAEDGDAIVKNDVVTYVVSDSSVFFYAGRVDENDPNRGKYKIIAHFDEQRGEVTLTTDNPDMKLDVNGVSHFSVEEEPDAVQPFLLHRFVTINDIDYSYTDYTSVPGSEVSYTVRGSLIMERKINTQIPDEDQAIDWD